MRFLTSTTRSAPSRYIPLLVAVFVVGAGIGAGAIVLSSGGGGTNHVVVKRILTAPPTPGAPARTPTAAQPTTPPPAATVHVTVGQGTTHIVDPQRTMNVGGQQLPRSFDTVIRYPIGLAGRFPLIVFGHGYVVTPASYTGLLNAWAKAGYVV